MIKDSELILNPDGSIYHLNLLPSDIAETIIFVGDPERVPKVSTHFDTVEIQKQKREFVTHTGTINGKRISVISTGIGTPNIDIVINELDALVNIDFETKQIKENHTSLNFIRIGTSGSIQEEIEVDSFLISEMAIGFDGLLNFYEEPKSIAPFYQIVKKEFESNPFSQMIYPTQAEESLVEMFSSIAIKGRTATLPGFYAPQGRVLRLNPIEMEILDKINKVGFTNFEMETAAIYGLASLLGHKAVSMNAIIANRVTGKFSEQPKETVKALISKTLELIQTNILV